ncbi:heme ABC transporter ATP-binding protein [Jiella avicenniae]|uniref:Heme ABC transporter ATP-binding protein n=1 Tax=Jiella avicenniae TaxID=2907202 RepID=A0A9X1TE22_9HYPH|nr:heme ABC transporter ATP-binding protein [Jiella avicenniae]MCE7030838.1 heme ABC transporter ATP-binding protein [Jiella avicenniae]
MGLAIEGVGVTAGGRTILQNVTARIAPGTLVAVIGPNGAGKSTLVKAMSGERRPAVGRVRLHGDDVSALAPAELAMQRAVLPQATSIAFPFTVFEIVGLGLRQRAGVDAAMRRLEVRRALAAVDLEGFGERLYQRLSGGEQQRVQLARVLCQIGKPVADDRAKLLILDEPTSSLDVRHQIAVLSIARRFADEGGLAVAVLHDLNLAVGFSDRLMVLEGGRLVADGKPEELLEGPMLAETFGTRMVVIKPPGWARPAVLPDLPRLDPQPR